MTLQLYGTVLQLAVAGPVVQCAIVLEVVLHDIAIVWPCSEMCKKYWKLYCNVLKFGNLDCIILQFVLYYIAICIVLYCNFLLYFVAI